jgi:hypothetical protein
MKGRNVKYTKEEFLKKVNNIHNNKYDYSLTDYINIRTKIKIICPIHGMFEQLPGLHFRYGCIKCRNDKFKSNNLKFINQADKIHNNKYDYSLVEYINAHANVKIICREHGVFEQTPTTHLRGSGCPKCGIGYSIGEEKIEKWLSDRNINYRTQYKFVNCKDFKVLPFDFYLPDYNVCVEFDGIHHYEPIKNRGGLKEFLSITKRDKIKDKFCLDNNIKLIRIPYWERREIDKILSLI